MNDNEIVEEFRARLTTVERSWLDDHPEVEAFVEEGDTDLEVVVRRMLEADLAAAERMQAEGIEAYRTLTLPGGMETTALATAVSDRLVDGPDEEVD